ncbi:MAG TPA: NAD(+) diphosphatase [Ferrovibrio sp.]|uniref:NAD(+) diphosphatase n=1 Tax=Ferrovibrio sp. TaxID=1917215 RepID=UPI002ED656CD
MLNPDPARQQRSSRQRPSRPIGFAGSNLDRAGNPRRNPAWLSEQRRSAQARFLPMRELKALIALDGRPGNDAPARIAWQDAAWDRAHAALPCIFLGLDEAGIPHFATDCDGDDSTAALHGDSVKFIDVRSIAPQLAPEEAAILAQARSLIDWHQRHRFCAQCGSPTRAAEGGYSRHCTSDACKAQHFPRTDPVVIMLAVRRDEASGQDMVLLGRQARFLPGMYSALAGFMEPGETIEEAVRREIFEEAGITTGAVRYVASQPWPFPSSLMIGCIAEAESAEITVDKDELEEARWFSRDEVEIMRQKSTDMEAAPRLSPPLALAHQLARLWLAGA